MNFRNFTDIAYCKKMPITKQKITQFSNTAIKYSYIMVKSYARAICYHLLLLNNKNSRDI